MIKIFKFFNKEKPRVQYVMVYKKVIDLDERYMVVSYRNHKREVFKKGDDVMPILKIPQNHTGISKTLRLPENIIEDIEALADIKNTSLNQISIILMQFALDHLDEEDKESLKEYRKEKQNEGA